MNHIEHHSDVVAPGEQSYEDLIDDIRAEVDRLAVLDPADAVESAADIASSLGRLLEEVER